MIFQSTARLKSDSCLIGTNIANPMDEGDIIGDVEQIQLTNMQASAVELRARGKERHCTEEHIF